MIMLHLNSRGTTFEYQRAPYWTTFSFCFLTVNQQTNASRSPGRATKNIFSVARGQMLVASGDRAPLEHSLVHCMTSQENRALTQQDSWESQDARQYDEKMANFHHEEITKLMFYALALRQSEWLIIDFTRVGITDLKNHTGSSNLLFASAKIWSQVILIAPILVRPPYAP